MLAHAANYSDLENNMATRRPTQAAPRQRRSSSSSSETEAGTLIGSTRTKRAARPSPVQLAPTVDANITDVEVQEYAREALFIYGSTVVEERAIPELRDGLKPSHRAMLYSLCVMGVPVYNGSVRGAVKSAKVVGTAMGNYHPHGDATYGAGVTIANWNPPLIHGIGNFGSPTDSPAAHRYSEMMMSRFSSLFMCDKRYLKVVPMIPTFSGDDEWPLYMPALLPTMLVSGNPTIPAYGVSAGSPTFGLRGVIKLVLGGLRRGGNIKDSECVKYLRIRHKWGTNCVSSEQDIADLITNGKGSLYYCPPIKADWKTKTIIIQSFTPAALSGLPSMGKTLDALSKIQGVSRTYDNASKRNKDAGPYGCAVCVECGRVSEDQFYEIAKKVEQYLTKSEHYDTGAVIHIEGEDKALFRRMSITKFLNLWIQYRIKLETRYLEYYKKETEDILHIIMGKLKVCATKQSVDRAIHLIRTASDPRAALMKEFSLDERQADSILNMQLRSIAKLAIQSLTGERDQLRATIADYVERLKNPGESARADLVDRVSRYFKNPDVTVSGMLVDDEAA